MPRRTLFLTLFGLAGLVACSVVACETPEETPVNEKAEQIKAPAQLQTPTPPLLPKPLMRQALHCCKNLTMEPIVRAYLALGVALADKNSAEITAQMDALSTALASSSLQAEKRDGMSESLSAMNADKIGTSRKAYAKISEVLVGTVQASQSGALDLAVAYSRQSDAHWLQEGVEPKSPYGDGIHSYSWGTREQVQEADALREKELGNVP
jgi:hypothetical protein